MKTFLKILLVIVVLLLLALWSPWSKWNIDLRPLFGVNDPGSIAGLVVNSLSGNIEVTVDNQVVGSASEDSSLIIDDVSPGEKLVKLRRISDVENAYWSYSKVVDFEEGTTAVLSFNLGPSSEYSEGHIIFFQKKVGDGANIHFSFDEDDVSVQVETQVFKDVNKTGVSVPLDTTAQKSIKIVKEGYEDLEFKLLPEDAEDRERVKDFDIYVDVYLMKQPVNVIELNDTGTVQD
jgi:hypothetical protein